MRTLVTALTLVFISAIYVSLFWVERREEVPAMSVVSWHSFDAGGSEGIGSSFVEESEVSWTE